MEFRHPSYYKKLKKQKAASVKPEDLAARNSEVFTGYKAASDKQQAASEPEQQAASDKPQAASREQQAPSYKK
jgi:hypothetical protein